MISSKSIALFSFKRFWYISYTSAIFSFLKSPFALTVYWSGSNISFFALLISDKTLLSVNILSSKPILLIHAFTNVLWSDVSKIINEESKPILSINLLKIRTHIEWNVPIHMSAETSPTKFPILSFISFAALFVNVIANMFHGFTCFSPIKYAILCVNTFVFPLPAPAITKHGPSVFTTASYCLSFNPFNISCIFIPTF